MIFVKPWIRIRNYSLTGWPARANFQFVYSQLLHLNFPPGKLKATDTNVAALLLTCVSAVLLRASNAPARAYSVRKQLSELRLVPAHFDSLHNKNKIWIEMISLFTKVIDFFFWWHLFYDTKYTTIWKEYHKFKQSSAMIAMLIV